MGLFRCPSVHRFVMYTSTYVPRTSTWHLDEIVPSVHRFVVNATGYITNTWYIRYGTVEPGSCTLWCRGYDAVRHQ